MTALETTKSIRAALRAAGITSKQVSVRYRSSLYDNAWDVTIKDRNISELQVKNICNAFSHVDREEGTGEILAGGNDYVFVQRKYGCPPDGSQYLNSVKETISKLEMEGQGEKINGTDWVIFKERGGFRGFCKDLEKIDWYLARFFAAGWQGVADSIASIIKGRELDCEYLKNKIA